MAPLYTGILLSLLIVSSTSDGSSENQHSVTKGTQTSESRGNEMKSRGDTQLSTSPQGDTFTSTATETQGEHIIMLNPEQMRVLEEEMPELKLHRTYAPVRVTTDLLEKIKTIVAKTVFKLPPGFPEELVEVIQSSVKSKPKTVVKTSVRSSNKVDEDPMEFVRKLNIYKASQGNNVGHTPEDKETLDDF